MASLDDFDDDNEQVTAELGNLGLTAAGFDYFNLDEPIEFCIGKIGSHVKFKSSEIVKLLCCLGFECTISVTVWNTGVLPKPTITGSDKS